MAERSASYWDSTRRILLVSAILMLILSIGWRLGPTSNRQIGMNAFWVAGILSLPVFIVEAVGYWQARRSSTH
jgi:hypothetical protein